MMGRGKPAALAVPVKQADEVPPEPTPRTIEGGPTVEPDAYGIYHAANTPVGARGARGSRAAFTAAGTAENRAEQLLISQMQTPERHRGGQGNYLVASPLPNISSPGLFASPNPVPLFQPSPKRQGLPSPGHHTGFEALFQSPMRGFNAELQAAADLLRFETPSRQPALDSLISPSPSKQHANNRRQLVPGSQGRRGRAVAFDVAAWRHAEEAGLAGGGGEDADFDLVKNLLQSPGPKELQVLQQEHQRSKLSRSTSSTPAGSPWSSGDVAAAAAGGDGGRAGAHGRRRALDFSKAEQMHRDLSGLPTMRRGGKQHDGSSGHLSHLADAAAGYSPEQHRLAGRDVDLQRQRHQDQQQQHGSSKFQPHLPLLPLDLSECERHNPSSTTGLTPKGPGAAANTVAERQRRHTQQQQQLFDDHFTPRSALDAAAAVVGKHAMDALTCMGAGSHEQQQAATDAALRSMAALPSSAYAGLSSSSGSGRLKSAAGAAAAAAAGAGPSSRGRGGLPSMVPLDDLSAAAAAAAGAGSDIAHQVLQLLQGDKSPAQQQRHGLVDHHLLDDYQQQQQQYDLADAAADAGEEDDAAEPASDGEEDALPGSASAAAAAGKGRAGSASKRSTSRQQARKSTPTSELQPSRRSRRIAGSTPDGDKAAASSRRGRTASPAPRSGSAGRAARKPARRTAEAAAEAEQQLEEPRQQQQLRRQEQEVDDTAQNQDGAAAMEVDETQEEQQQQQQLVGTEAEEEDEEDEEQQAAATDEGPMRTRSRSGSSRKSSSKKDSRSRSQQQQQSGSEATAAAADTDAAAAAAAAAAAVNLAAVSGLDPATLAQHAAYLPGLQHLAQLQMLQGYGVTPDKRTGRLAGGLLGPGTPDDVRMAHMGLQFTANMRSCHCKKSQCLKLYCDCFANNQYCNGCACLDCKNVEANAQEVIAKRVNIQQRDPNAFTHKLAQRADTLTNRKGCKCKKSHCLKKYCECYQLGVRCGDLCKCVDCHNCGEIEGALPLPTASILQQQQQRMQHAAAAAAAAAGAYWPLGQALPAVSAGAATPTTSVGMAQAQLLLRLQGTVPATPCSAPLAAAAGGPAQAAEGAVGASAEHATGDRAAAAAAGGVGQAAATPLAAVASTPNPPKSARQMSHDSSSLRSTAKPLLPEFMQAAADAATPAAAAAAGASFDRFAVEHQQRMGSARKMLLQPTAAAEAGEDQLPTPDQAYAEQRLLQMRDTSSDLETGATAAAAAAAAEATAAAAAAADTAARQHFDAAALAGMPLSHADFASYAMQQGHGFVCSPTVDPASKLQQRSPARAKAAASSSSGGDSRAGPMSSAAAVPGSVTSKGTRHRLASSSRAAEEEVSTEHLHTSLLQQQQQYGLAALVAGAAAPAAAAAAAAGAAKHQGGQLSNARRQLLQQISQDAAALPDRNALAWQQQQQLAAQHGYDAPAADAAGNSSGGSPGQPVLLGPDGPMLVLPQHILRAAMNQAAAAFSTAAIPAAAAAAAAPAAATVPGAADAASGGSAGTAAVAAMGVPRQTAGMLMAVTDEQGNVQYYFLPHSQADAAAAAAAAAAEVKQEQPAAQGHDLRSLLGQHNAWQPSLDDPMQVDESPAAFDESLKAASQQQLEPSEEQQGTAIRHYQQQQQVYSTPTKGHPPGVDEEQFTPGAAAARARSLRSAGAAAAAAGGGQGGSCKTTPSKRTTPVKRKAEGEDANHLGLAASPKQFGPSPAKLPHQLSPPSLSLQLGGQQQASPSQPVVLSPVKLAPAALAGGSFAGAGAAAGADSTAAGRRSLRSSRAQGGQQRAQPPQQQQQVLLPAAAPQEMQLFLATTSDGQQLLLRAPAGTDPQSLIGADGTVQSCYLAAVLPNTPAASQQQQQTAPAAAAGLPPPPQQQQSPSSRRSLRQALQVDMPGGGSTYACPSRITSASLGRVTASPSGLLRFSPGKTVFSPKGSSPSKPLLGNSPGR